MDGREVLAVGERCAALRAPVEGDRGPVLIGLGLDQVEELQRV
jgi:hypothetical protein